MVAKMVRIVHYNLEITKCEPKIYTMDDLHSYSINILGRINPNGKGYKAHISLQ